MKLIPSLAVMLSLALPVAAQDADATAPAPAIVEMTEGSPEATVEVIEYASFTCPHCAHFHEDQYKQLRENYIDTGKIRFTFREVYFDRPGLWASMIARCGGEMRYFGVADMLMSEQRDWIGDGQGAGIVERLQKIGKRAGLSEDALMACMQDGEKAQALVDWSQANADAHDIKATPSIVINGETYSNMSYADIAKILEEKLAE